MKFDWAPNAFRRLNGILCVYKPAEMPVFKVMETLQNNLTRDLNALPCYRYERRMQKTDPDFEARLPTVTTVPATLDDLSDHRLVLGPRYIPSDVRLRRVHGMSRHSTGILVLGVGSGRRYVEHLALARYLRVYHVQGRFGMMTHNFTPKGKIIQSTSFHHITKSKLDKICASIQAAHTKHMFDYAGVRPDSQEAYELASFGLVRPASGQTPPMLYGIKCIEFDPPDFTLEIHSINEKSEYFNSILHDIGLELKSSAVCTHIRRIRYGYFTLDHALLRKHWNLEQVINNLRMCRSLLTLEKLASDLKVRKLVSYGHRLRRIGSSTEEENTDKTSSDKHIRLLPE